MGSKKPPLAAVVDTNVIAYYLLDTQPFGEEVRRFWRGIGEVAAPASWEAELTNVLWLAVRAKVIDVEQGRTKLELARQLAIESVPVRDLWESALVLASKHDHPAYDAVFVELANRRGLPLVTYDSQLLAAFPECAVAPTDFFDH